MTSDGTTPNNFGEELVSAAGPMKTYSRPVLTLHGNVGALTKGSKTSGNDGSGGKKN